MDANPERVLGGADPAKVLGGCSFCNGFSWVQFLQR